MKNYILLFLCFMAFSSCVNENISNDKEQVTEEILPIGVVPTDLDFFKIITDVEHNTWQDLDNYYRNEILKNHADKSYFESLKNMSFFAFTRTFNLLENADNETIEYYFQQQVETAFLSDTDVFIEFLDKLKKENVLTGEQVVEIGTKKYFAIMDHIQNNFADPKFLLEEKGKAYRLGMLLKYSSVADKD